MEEQVNTDFILPLDDQKATLALVGGKGASLARMAQAGLPVPDGYYVTTEAYRQFVSENRLQSQILKALEAVEISNPGSLESASQTIIKLFTGTPIPTDIANAVVLAYGSLPGENPAVAVRSSATAEDLPEASFAGQQDTYLNMRGADAVLDAVRRCWASLWTARAIGYRARQGINPDSVMLAVVVQSLVSADAAGILFTANPMNGRRDQMLINASWGLGEAVVGGLVTPDSLTLEVTSFRVIGREIGEKLVQTVQVDGGTAERSIPKNLRRLPVLSDEQATELAQFGLQIETLFGMPMDIEWALASGVFAIVQARPITALPEPEPSPPTEWKLPKGAYAAMRNNIIELMTDPLMPLFKSFGLRAINTSMNRYMVGFLGDTGVLPGEPIIAVNEYAYYNGSVKFGPMLKVILDSRGILKRMFSGAVERWTEEGRPHYLETVERWEKSDWQALSATELLNAAGLLAEAAIDAYGALVSGVIPAAWMSEAWFTFIYKLLKRRDGPPAPTYLMGFDSLPIRAEKSLYDIAAWAKNSSELADYLESTPTPQLVSYLDSNQTPSGVDVDDWRDWQLRFQAHQQKFGHTIYNLDFGNPVPADDPAPVIETLKMYLSGEGTNPHERQRDSAERREAATQAMLERLNGRRLKSFQKNLERAQKYAPLREDGLADVGLSYPLLRQMFFELGRRFVVGGLIEKPEDIYWLEGAEVEDAVVRLDAGLGLKNLTDVIPPRKATWRAARRAVPPMALPQIKIFGVDLMELRAKKGKGDSLKGVAASPGTVTAPACVLHGPEDFSKMKMGDVLVASLTTPAWTPLFARASAVVTDIGGPLSHGSIVAREYGIPAVLGTGAATTRITHGETITVDGTKGKVYLG
jgi:phosphohistidine swiveling domain-containing protein